MLISSNVRYGIVNMALDNHDLYKYDKSNIFKIISFINTNKSTQESVINLYLCLNNAIIFFILLL